MDNINLLNNNQPGNNNLQQNNNALQNNQNNNALQNNQNNLQNNQNNIQNEPVNRIHVPKAPQVKLSTIQGNLSSIKDRIRSNQTSFFRKVPGFRNSKEFREARDAFNKFSSRWQKMGAAKISETRRLSGWEIVSLYSRAEHTRDAINAYLDAKKKECGDDYSRLPSRTRKRVITMLRAKDALDEQIEELDRRQEIIDNEPVKSVKDLCKESEKAYDAMNEHKDVFWSSSEYKDAFAAYKNLFDLMEKLDQKDEKDISVAEMDEARRLANVAGEKISAYLHQHENEDDFGKNRLSRMSAMSDGFDSAERIMKKFSAMYDKAMETPSNKTFDEISTSVRDAYNGIVGVNWDVKIGSSEFRAARKAYKEFNKVFELYRNKGDFKNLTAGEIRTIEKKMDIAEAAIDKYLYKKAGERKQSDAAVNRTDAMNEAKAAILETKRKFKELENQRKQAASAKNDIDVKRNLDKSYDDVTSRLNQAFFGSIKYMRARESYIRVHDDMVIRRLNNNKQSEAEIKETLKDIDTAKKDISSYIKAKHKQIAKKGPLDDKGKRRLAAMEKAYESLDTLSHKLNAKLKKDTVKYDKEKNASKEKGISFKESYKQQDGAARYIERGASDGYTYIGQMDENSTLTESAKKMGRASVILILLNMQKDAGGVESMECADSWKAYNKTVMTLTNSKQFKEALPNEKITPKFLLKLINDPNAMEKLRKKFSAELRTGNPEGKSLKGNAPKNEIKNPIKPEPKAPTM